MALVFLAVSHAFEADLLRASTDDLAAIGKAYVEAEPRGKALHEAKEMIDDRLLATNLSRRLSASVRQRRKSPAICRSCR